MRARTTDGPASHARWHEAEPSLLLVTLARIQHSTVPRRASQVQHAWWHLHGQQVHMDQRSTTRLQQPLQRLLLQGASEAMPRMEPP